MPPPPQIPIKEDMFNFPLGEYLEVKRKSGKPFKVPDKPAPKPKKEPSISGTDPSIIVSIPLHDLPPGQNPVSSSSAPPHPPAEKNIQFLYTFWSGITFWSAVCQKSVQFSVSAWSGEVLR